MDSQHKGQIMENEPRWNGIERRDSPRVAGQGELRAAVMDAHSQTRRLLAQAQVVNVSGSGIAFTSADACELGDTIAIRTPQQETRPFTIKIVGANRRGDGRSELRGRLIDGAIPACLMYGW